MHHLSITLGFKHVKQKLWKMNPHVALLVKVELKKILKDGFIREIDYVKWISNIVLVSKHEKSIHVCIEFQDLNLTSPKDDFLLPNIDMIVNMMIGYEMHSLMNGFSSYN